jgi:hypothetical protein
MIIESCDEKDAVGGQRDMERLERDLPFMEDLQMFRHTLRLW